MTKCENAHQEQLPVLSQYFQKSSAADASMWDVPEISNKKHILKHLIYQYSITLSLFETNTAVNLLKHFHVLVYRNSNFSAHEKNQLIRCVHSGPVINMFI